MHDTLSDPAIQGLLDDSSRRLARGREQAADGFIEGLLEVYLDSSN